MKSWFIKSSGHSMSVELRDVPVPQPGEGEIVLRMHASAFNRGELIAGHGLHKGGDAKPAGIDAAGEVHAVGKGVTGIKPGDRIMGRARGAFSEYAVMPAHQAMPIPQRLTWEQASAVPLVYQTSYDLLYPYGKLKAGEWLLVVGVSSGVGVSSTQIAKVIGAKVIGTSGSADKLAKLKSIGLDVGIQTRGADFAERVKEATGGKGANLAINNVGGTVFSECMRALAYEGRLATVGYVDGSMESKIDLELLHEMRLHLFAVSNKRAPVQQRIDQCRNFQRDVLPAIADGRIVPVVDRVFAFDEVPAAKQYVESNALVGKVVVKIA
jgi:NADPH2:quinone reductase